MVRRRMPDGPTTSESCRKALSAEPFRRGQTSLGRKLRLLRTLYEQKNSDFWRGEIAASKGDSRRLWLTFKNVLGVTPTADCDGHTTEDFAHFFQDKVETVRASSAATPPYYVPHRSTPTIRDWSVVTSDEVEKLIGSLPRDMSRDMSVGPRHPRGL